MPAFAALSAALHVALLGVWLDLREPIPEVDIHAAATRLSLNLLPPQPLESPRPRSEPDPDLSFVQEKVGSDPIERSPASAPRHSTVGSDPIHSNSMTGEEKLGSDPIERSLGPAPGPSFESPRAESAVPSGFDPVRPKSAIIEEDLGSDPVGPVTAEQLAVRVHEAVQPYFEYPLLARRQGWEGEVRLMLRVEADGRLSVLRVLSSSGHRLLDRAAVEALDRLARLPDARGLPHMGMETELPVRYRLVDPA